MKRFPSLSNEEIRAILERQKKKIPPQKTKKTKKNTRGSKKTKIVASVTIFQCLK